MVELVFLSIRFFFFLSFMVGLLEKSASPDSMTMLRPILSFFLHLFLTERSSVFLLLVIVFDQVS